MRPTLAALCAVYTIERSAKLDRGERFRCSGCGMFAEAIGTPIHSYVRQANASTRRSSGPARSVAPGHRAGIAKLGVLKALCGALVLLVAGYVGGCPAATILE